MKSFHGPLEVPGSHLERRLCGLLINISLTPPPPPTPPPATPHRAGIASAPWLSHHRAGRGPGLLHWLPLLFHRQLYGSAPAGEDVLARCSVLPRGARSAGFHHDSKKALAVFFFLFFLSFFFFLRPTFFLSTQPRIPLRPPSRNKRCARINAGTLSGHRERRGACNRETRTGGGGGGGPT